MASIFEHQKLTQQASHLPIGGEQAIQERQSFALVHTLLHFAIAKITFLRQLFPENCFERRDPALIEYESDRFFERQREFTSNSHGVNVETLRRGKPLMVLRRNSNVPAAMSVLDWLDTIFECLLDHNLAHAEFCIYTDKANPQQVLEKYTFSFHYSENRHVVGMALPEVDSEKGKNIVTPTGARSSLQKFQIALHDYDQCLPDLPPQRYLMCRLLHPPKATPPQPPAGFEACQDRTQAFPQDKFWCKHQRDFGEQDFGSFSVGLNMSYTALVDDTGYSLSDIYRIPDNLTYVRRGSKAVCHKTSPSTNAQNLDTLSIEQSTETNNSWNRSEDTKLHDEDLDLRSSSRGGQNVTSGKGPRETSKSNSTLRTLSSNSLIPTQIMAPAIAASRSSIPMRLLQGKSLEMESKKNLRFAEGQKSLAETDIVRCECGFDQEEGELTQCECCEMRQHYHCYGFVLNTPGDNQHFCYRCLFEGSERARLEELKELARFRRAVWILFQYEPISQKAFQGKYRCDSRSLTKIVKRLKTEGFLNKKGKAWRPITSPEQRNLWHGCYSDPLTLIGHQYEAQTNPLRAASQSEELSSSHKRARLG